MGPETFIIEISMKEKGGGCRTHLAQINASRKISAAKYISFQKLFLLSIKLFDVLIASCTKTLLLPEAIYNKKKY